MGKNCLVTKLNAVVNNSNLSKLGVIEFDILADTTFNTDHAIGIRCTQPVVVTTTANFNNYSGVSIGNSVTIQGNQPDIQNVLPSIDAAHIMIKEKYPIKWFIVRFRLSKPLNLEQFTPLNDLEDLETSLCGDFDNIKKLSSLTKLLCTVKKENEEGLEGDISSVSSLSGLTYLSVLDHSGIYGNIASLGTLTNLLRLDIGGTKVEGSVEEFVARQRGAGRTTCEGIACAYLGNSKVTFNNIAAPVQYTQSISWTATQITLGSTTIDNSDVITE